MTRDGWMRMTGTFHREPADVDRGEAGVVAVADRLVLRDAIGCDGG
jgi:hypothetical protein